MPVLGSLARLATHNPDRRLLESSGALAGVLGSYNTERRMKAFGDDLIDAVESGKKLSQNDFLSLVHKHKLKPDEATKTLELIKKSGALSQTRIPTKYGAMKPEHAWRYMEKTEEPDYEHLTIYGPGGQTMRIPHIKGRAYAPPQGWSLKPPAQEKEPRALKSWITPDNKIIHIPNNQKPPKGSKPYTKPEKPSETEKTIEYKLWGELRSMTHDEEGTPRESIPVRGIDALNKRAQRSGKEIVKVDIPEYKTPAWHGVGDKPARSIYIIIDKDQEQINQEDIIEILVKDYGYDEDEARMALK